MSQLVSLKQIKNRIRSVENTEKITHAMELISISKMKSTGKILSGFRPYFEKIESSLSNIFQYSPDIKHPLAERRKKIKNIGLCVITSDTGLCSTYNNDIIRTAENFVKKYGKENIIMFCIGKKGFAYFKQRGLSIPNVYADLHSRFSSEIQQMIYKDVLYLYTQGNADEIYFAYARFESSSRNKPVIEKYLNIEMDFKKGNYAEYIFEPDRETLLQKLIPEYLSSKIKIILLNAFLSEHSTRLISMTKATNNAKELIEDLILARNKIRQANITNEIIDIISSSEALKG